MEYTVLMEQAWGYWVSDATVSVNFLNNGFGKESKLAGLYDFLTAGQPFCDHSYLLMISQGNDL